MKKIIVLVLLFISMFSCVGYVEVADPYPVPHRNPIHVPRTERVICQACHGTGRIKTMYGYPRQYDPRHRYAICRICNGKGYVYRTIRYNDIPRRHRNGFIY